MLYEIHAFGGSDFVHDFSQRRPQRLDRPITFTAKHGFDFAEQQLDRIEIRRIGWQVTDFRLGGFGKGRRGGWVYLDHFKNTFISASYRSIES